MMAFIPPRLRKPVVNALAGTAFASAWLIRGGPTWWFSIVVEAGVIGRAVALYSWGGEDSDEGALAGSRADERQRLLGMRSRALAGNFAMIASLAGMAITVAARSVWWPFAVMFIVTGLGYLFGLSFYGSGDSDPADELSAEARSPVTS